MIAARQIAFGKGGKKLPYDCEIEYLESTGTQWIDTGVTITDDDLVNDGDVTMACKFSVKARNGRVMEIMDRMNGQTVTYGMGDEASSKVFVPFVTYRTAGTNGAINSVREVKEMSLGRVVIDGIEYTNALPTERYAPRTSFKLFKDVIVHTGAESLLSATLYSFAIKTPSQEIDLIPVRKGNVGYMYDKVSGKLFGNSGTGDFVLGPDIEAIAYTAKDYVQDGLVAMWDVRDNAGFGVHTEESVITNLVTGESVSIPNDGSYLIADNCVEANPNKSLLLGRVDGNASNEWTLESVGCCVTKPSDPFNISGDFSFIGVGGVHMWREDSMGATGAIGAHVCSNSGRTWYYGAPSDKNTALQEARLEIFGVSHSRSAVFDKDNVTQYGADSVICYFDGIAKNGVHGMSYSDASPLNPSYEVFSPLSTSAKNRWHSLRIYSRALTAEEIAHNYEIDKARFGL